VKRYDEPTCNHGTLDVIVTNQPEHDPIGALRSVWVCAALPCVLDAMAWVARGTGTAASWRIGTTGEWRTDMYTEPSEPEHSDGR
jgi:hypothetical protein